MLRNRGAVSEGQSETADPARRPLALRVMAGGMTGESHAVLLVEDDDLQIRLYRAMFDHCTGRGAGAAGSEPVVAVDAVRTLEDARRELEGASEPFDLVLLDLNLPDSTGLETLDSVLETDDRTAVVVLTGIDDVATGRTAIERGAEDYLVKDHVTPRLLTRTVTYAIERRARAAELERQRREMAVLHWLVRHEIRDAVAVIMGWTGELSPSGPGDERTVSRIVDAGEEIVALTESVGTMIEALEEGETELTAVDLSSVLGEEIERVESRHGVEVAFDGAGEAVRVRADRFLNVVVRTLLTNAVAHDPDGVAVSVPSETAAGFVVSGVGPEFSGSEYDRATDEGFTADGSRRSVGTYLIRTFLDRYGGCLEVEERSEGGATVRVSLEAPA